MVGLASRTTNDDRQSERRARGKKEWGEEKTTGVLCRGIGRRREEGDSLRCMWPSCCWRWWRRRKEGQLGGGEGGGEVDENSAQGLPQLWPPTPNSLRKRVSWWAGMEGRMDG